MVDILLDTSFLYPTLGFEVKGITKKDFEILGKISKAGARICCSYISFVEIFGKLAKASNKPDRDIVNDGMKSLLDSGYYHWVDPTTEALENAFSLRLRGHKDSIDNILYSIALTSGMLFLSFDEKLKNFLVKNGFDSKIIVGPAQLAVKFKGDSNSQDA